MTENINYLSRTKKLLIDSGRFDPREFFPASLASIREFEQSFGPGESIPGVLREYLEFGGRFNVMDVWYHDLPKIEEMTSYRRNLGEFSEMVERSPQRAFPLPAEAIILTEYLGQEFQFVTCSEGDDPPVYEWNENDYDDLPYRGKDADESVISKEVDFRKIADHLSEWIYSFAENAAKFYDKAAAEIGEPLNEFRKMREIMLAINGHYDPLVKDPKLRDFENLFHHLYKILKHPQKKSLYAFFECLQTDLGYFYNLKPFPEDSPINVLLEEVEEIFLAIESKLEGPLPDSQEG